MNNPFISVIIPVYNRYDLLLEAVDSVKAQSFSDYEIIIVDDGSTDRTIEIKNDPDVRYFRFDHSGMPGLSRNRGMKEARGKYLAFLDSDDLWLPGKLQKQVDFFKTNPCIKWCHTREIWNRQGKIISQKGQKHKREGNIFEDALVKCMIGPSTVMIDAEVFWQIGGFREDLEIAEDYECWLRMAADYPAGYIDEPLIIKRAGAWDQLSEKYGQIEIFRIAGLEDLVERGYFSGENRIAAERELSRKASIYSAGCCKRGREEDAEHYRKLAERWKRD